MKVEPRYNKGDRIGGRYQVHQGLMGGMGEVYLCLDLEEMVPYALKTFQQRYLEQASRLRRAFEQEVLVWVALEKHPNIVRCFHMDTLDNQPFMVLEWVAGEEDKGVDLRGWLRQGPLGLRQALDFAIDICYGLVHAQQKQPGIVHRDLKPENILIAQGGLTKITDFGLAQMVMQADLKVAEWAAPDSPAASNLQQSLAVQGGVAGTPPYMPPEQWHPGVSLDERADIYAVGCILVEMLTGRPPFTVDIQPTTPATYQRWLSAWQWQHEHAARPLIPDTLPAPLAALLVNCLARDRDERPQAITDLLARLQQVYTHFFGQPPRPAPVSSEFSFGDYNNRGATYHALSRYKEALYDYDQAIHLNPTLVEVYTNRGVTYADLRRYDEALADFGEAIRRNPAYAQAFYNRALTYDTLGRYEEALADYAQAIRLNPTYATAYTNRGITYDTLGRYDEALADYERAIRLNPAYAETYINRGLTYKYLRRYDEALADYKQAIRLNPTNATAFYNRGNTYQSLGRYEEALADYERAIRLNPAYAEAYINRGNTYQNLGRYEEALADYEHALRLNPADADTYTNRGAAYDTLERYEEALSDYAQAIRLNPGNANAYLNMGALLANRGQHREALPYFEKAAALGEPIGAQYASQARRKLGENPSQSANSAQQAFAAFRQAGSEMAMAQVVAQYPFMVDEAFMATVEQAINQQVPPEHRPAFEQRLTWLHQIAAKQ